MQSFFTLSAFLLNFCTAAIAADSLIDSDSLVIIVRSVERLLIVIASLFLFIMGFNLIKRGRSSGNNGQSITFKIGPSFDVSMNGHGPGLACVLVGACLAGLSILSVPKVDAKTGKVLFFDRKDIDDIKNTQEYEFLAGSKLLLLDCKEEHMSNRKKAYCGSIIGYRDSIIGSRYGEFNRKFIAVKQKYDSKITLDDDEVILYTTGVSIF